MEIKICTKCDEKYPATKEYFVLDNRRKNGLGSHCRKCHYNTIKNWKNKNPKKCSEAVKKYKQTIIGCLRNRFYNIKDRCTNIKHPTYEYYGGRGISCLFKSSQEFIDYVVNELQVDPRGLDIHRIDNNGNYERGNIQFITHIENIRKRI